MLARLCPYSKEFYIRFRGASRTNSTSQEIEAVQKRRVDPQAVALENLYLIGLDKSIGSLLHFRDWAKVIGRDPDLNISPFLKICDPYCPLATG